MEKNIPVRSFPFPRFEQVLLAIITGADLGLGVREIRAVLRSFYERYSRQYQPPVCVQGTMSDAIANCRYSTGEKERILSCNETTHLHNYK